MPNRTLQRIGIVSFVVAIFRLVDSLGGGRKDVAAAGHFSCRNM